MCHLPSWNVLPPSRWGQRSTWPLLQIYSFRILRPTHALGQMSNTLFTLSNRPPSGCCMSYGFVFNQDVLQQQLNQKADWTVCAWRWSFLSAIKSLSLGPGSSCFCSELILWKNLTSHEVLQGLPMWNSTRMRIRNIFWLTVWWTRWEQGKFSELIQRKKAKRNDHCIFGLYIFFLEKKICFCKAVPLSRVGLSNCSCFIAKVQWWEVFINKLQNEKMRISRNTSSEWRTLSRPCFSTKETHFWNVNLGLTTQHFWHIHKSAVRRWIQTGVLILMRWPVHPIASEMGTWCHSARLTPDGVGTNLSVGAVTVSLYGKVCRVCSKVQINEVCRPNWIKTHSSLVSSSQME